MPQSHLGQPPRRHIDEKIYGVWNNLPDEIGDIFNRIPTPPQFSLRDISMCPREGKQIYFVGAEIKTQSGMT